MKGVFLVLAILLVCDCCLAKGRKRRRARCMAIIEEQETKIEELEAKIKELEKGKVKSQESDLLVGYWGQNGAGFSSGQCIEAPLETVCQTTEYDIIVLAFLLDTAGNMNFACHGCNGQASPDLPGCSDIANGIKQCQSKGKKVQLSIGGATGSMIFNSAEDATTFANWLNDMFLGGTGAQDERPFGNAILDGIDLDIEGGSSDYYTEFVTELRSLMDADTSKTYLITGAPQCPFPDHYLNEVLTNAGEKFDYVYVQFYNNYCEYSSSPEDFNTALDQWLNLGEGKFSVIIGQPAATGGAGSGYIPPDELDEMYTSVDDEDGVTGIMLWDVSWDQVNVIDGKRYSEYAYETLHGESPTGLPTTPPKEPTATLPTELPVTTSSTPTTSPECPSCATLPTGSLIPKPSDCTKYYQCVSGKPVEEPCPEGLVFNPSLSTCDWPDNYQCPVTCTGKDDGVYEIECDSSTCYLCCDEIMTQFPCTDGEMTC